MYPPPPPMTPEPIEITNRNAAGSWRQIAILTAFVGAECGIVIGMLVAVGKATDQLPLDVGLPLALGGSVFGSWLGVFLGWISRHNAGLQSWLLRIAACALMSVLGTALGWTFAPYPNWGQYRRLLPRSMVVGALIGFGLGLCFCLIQALYSYRKCRRESGVSVVDRRPRSLAASRLDFMLGAPFIAVIHCVLYWGIIAVAMGRAEHMRLLAKVCLGVSIAILSFPLMYLGLLFALLINLRSEGPLILLSIVNSVLWGIVIMRAASRM